MANCIFTTGSVTQAMKAKRILAEHSIAVNTIKVSTDNSKRGCVHGIEFNCQNSGNISRILHNSGIGFEVGNGDLFR